MKRALLAILILSVGTTVFCTLRHTTSLTRSKLETQRQEWQRLTQQVAGLRIEKHHLTERWNETKRQLATEPPLPTHIELAKKILAGTALESISAAEREQLLAELGFNWNTTGDYLIISKKSLEGISFRSIQGDTLTDATRAALTITPTEQATLETLVQRLEHERSEWAKAHVQREEPSGLTVAKYVLPMDATLAETQRSFFTNTIRSTLGEVRGDLFQQKSWGWMDAMGMLSGPEAAYANKPTSLTVNRYAADRDDLGYTLQQGYSMMSSSVLPWQPFPEAFRAIFPGGWEELAQKEGFELPKEFRQRKPQ
ncbi:MAG: hypothetical protein QM813_16090 [Verrucomicrobiota bacterium]